MADDTVRQASDEEPSQRQDHTAQLQSGTGAAPQGGFQADQGHSKEAPLLEGSIRPKTTHKRTNVGKMGTGTSKTESTGGCACSSRTEIPRYTRASGVRLPRVKNQARSGFVADLMK